MNHPLAGVLLIFILLVFNGVFSMSEIALVSARKTRLQQRAEEGEKGAQVALELSENTNRLLSTVQIGRRKLIKGLPKMPSAAVSALSCNSLP